MDIKRGLEQLQACLAQRESDRLPDFHALEARFDKNANDELILGVSENTRNERNQVMRALNALALRHCGVSFNALCKGGAPPLSGTQPSQAPPAPNKKIRSNKGGKGQSVPTHASQIYHGIHQAWAVLVGVNQYQDPFIASLSVCVDDVTAIQQMLAGGYQIAKLLTDATPERPPTRANILGELAAVAQSAAEEDLLLFYFSGHGIAEGGESYLLARDTRLAALKHTAVAIADVRELMAQSPAHAKVIVIDACHSGASIGKAEPRMTPEFIERVFAQAEGMAVLASCKQGQKSWEWSEQGRSVFTYYLLDALTGKADFDGKGFVTIGDANRYVTDGVKTWAAEKGVPQTPTLQYTGAGDIILLRYGEEVHVSTPSPQVVTNVDISGAEKDVARKKEHTILEHNEDSKLTVTQISRAQKRELVNALLECPTMRDRHTRDVVVDELRADIRNGIRRHTADRVDVNNIVTRCLNYASGVEELVEIVRDFEGDSVPMQALNRLEEQYGF